MSATERVVQSILYELGCVLIGCLVMQFVPHEGQPLVLMVIFFPCWRWFGILCLTGYLIN